MTDIFRMQDWGSSPARASRVLTLPSCAPPAILPAPPPSETLATSRGMRLESLLACIIVQIRLNQQSEEGFDVLSCDIAIFGEYA